MFAAIKRFFRLFTFTNFNKLIRSVAFVHPVVHEGFRGAIDQKIKDNTKKQDELIKIHTEHLNSLLATLFSRTYESSMDMRIAYELLNKEWKKYCKEVNSTERLINLKHGAFTERFKQVIETTKQNKNNGKK